LAGAGPVANPKANRFLTDSATGHKQFLLQKIACGPMAALLSERLKSESQAKENRVSVRYFRLSFVLHRDTERRASFLTLPTMLPSLATILPDVDFVSLFDFLPFPYIRIQHPNIRAVAALSFHAGR